MVNPRGAHVSATHNPVTKPHHSSYHWSSHTLSFFHQLCCPLYRAMHNTCPVHQPISSSVRPSVVQSVHPAISPSIGHILSNLIPVVPCPLSSLVSCLGVILSLVSSLSQFLPLTSSHISCPPHAHRTYTYTSPTPLYLILEPSFHCTAQLILHISGSHHLTPIGRSAYMYSCDEDTPMNEHMHVYMQAHTSM